MLAHTTAMSVGDGPTRLRKRQHHDAPKTIVITVAGIGTTPPDAWFDQPRLPWLHFLSDDSLPSPIIYDFDHNLDLNNSTRLWKDINARSSDLLEAILGLFRRTTQMRRCALMFMAHSLGGIIVKDCISRILERRSDFADCARALALFVAIGTPHSTSDNPREWNHPQLLIAAQNRLRRGQSTREDDAIELSKLCRRFEQVAAGLPILTLCETRDTPIKSLLLSMNKTRIVPRDACEVHSRREEYHEVDGDHLQICKKIPRVKLQQIIKVAIANARARIRQELPNDIDPPSLSEQAMGINTEVSHQANLGQVLIPVQNSNQATVAVSSYQTEVMAGLTDFSTMRRDPNLPCHIVPDTFNRDFFGRQDILEKIHEYLVPELSQETEQTLPRTYAICGPGGIGKTQTARRYALEHAGNYEAIFWVHAEAANTLANDFSRIAEVLGLVLPDSTEAKDQDLSREVVKGWLSKPVRTYQKTDNTSVEEVPWLLIFDNVSSVTLIHDYWPLAGSNGSILITSRDTVAKSGFYQVKDGIDLPPLQTNEAAELLLRLTWRESNTEDKLESKNVAEVLGGFPLAMTQMASYIVRQNLSFSHFLRRYEEDKTRGDLFRRAMGPSHRRMDYNYTLASVWSMETLSCSLGLLDVLAFLDPDNIPEVVLQDAIGQSNLADYPKTVAGYDDACAELFKTSLVYRQRQGPKNSLEFGLTVHRLIQDVARARMQEEEDRLTAVFQAATDIIFARWPAAEPGVRHHIARWKECESLSSHIERLKAHFMKIDAPWKDEWKSSLRFATLLNELGWYYTERGQTRDAYDCFIVAQENAHYIIESGSDVEKATYLLAETHNNLAGTATELNDGDTALQHFRIYNKMLLDEAEGPNAISDSRLPSSFYNVGLSYTMKSLFNDAVDWLKDALQSAEKLNDPMKVKNARSLGLINLALTYWLMNKLEDAYDTLTMALTEREEMLGLNDRQSMITGRILYGFGNTLQSQGDSQRSLHFHERALQHFKETVGNTHHRVGNSCFKVAEHYWRLNRFPEARLLLEQGIRIFRSRDFYPAEQGRCYLLMSFVLAKLETNKGNDGASEEPTSHEEALSRALKLYQEVNGSFRPKTDPLTLEHFSRAVHVWGR